MSIDLSRDRAWRQLRASEIVREGDQARDGGPMLGKNIGLRASAVLSYYNFLSIHRKRTPPNPSKGGRPFDSRTSKRRLRKRKSALSPDDERLPLMRLQAYIAMQKREGRASREIARELKTTIGKLRRIESHLKRLRHKSNRESLRVPQPGAESENDGGSARPTHLQKS